jgi:hypothetical protein
MADFRLKTGNIKIPTGYCEQHLKIRACIHIDKIDTYFIYVYKYIWGQREVRRVM